MIKYKHYQMKPTTELILVRVMHTLGLALFIVGSTLYFKSLGMTNAEIGLTTSIGVGLHLLYALFLPRILRTKNMLTLLLASIGFISAMLLLFSIAKTPFMAVLVFIVLQLGIATFRSAYNLLFHDDALSEEDYKKENSLLGSLLCFSWTIGPLLATLLIEAYSFQTLFLFGAALSMLSIIPLLLQKIPVHKIRQSKHVPSVFFTLKTFVTNPKIRSVYLITSSTDLWWTYILVFMALFLKDFGFSDQSIGLFLTLTQLPLFLLEFAAYKIVVKYNYKLPYRIAYGWLITVLAGTAVFGIGHPVSIVLLIAGSLSLAFIEPTENMLFFDAVKMSDQANFFPIFGTNNAFSSLMIRLIIGSTLIFFSATSTLFVMIGILFFLMTQTRHLKS